MKRQGDTFILYGLFVDDILHIQTFNKHKQEFLKKYSMHFNIKGGGLMETFFGMLNEIRLHQDNYILPWTDARLIARRMRPRHLS
jgi:hypothetical protein